MKYWLSKFRYWYASNRDTYPHDDRWDALVSAVKKANQ